MSICQLQKAFRGLLLVSFFAMTLAGCSHTAAPENKDRRLIRAEWNKLPLRFSHQVDNEIPIAHPFFDVDPQIKNFSADHQNNKNIHFLLTNDKNSNYQYELDLYSGKLYRERAFCPQDDIWQNYSGDLLTPNFYQGIVPRVYDENKNPIKLVLISNEKFIEPFSKNPTHFDEARIVGSVIVDSCEFFPCDIKSKWNSSQILFAVSGRDPSYQSIKTFSELKNKIDWNYTKAMLANMHGYHKMGGKVYPSHRVTKELNLRDTYAYFTKNAQVLDGKKMGELKTWQTQCTKLYDSIWDEAEKIRAKPNGQADAFLNYFRQFYLKHSNEFYECQKLVRPANIVENNRRLWFFSYIQAFTLLEKNGFYYSCVENSWAYNPRVDETKYYVDQNKELDRCRSKNFEKSFDQAINGMSLLKNQTNRQFRFIEYDTFRGGSHQQIYGWIHGKVQNYACKYESKTPNSIPFDIFPQDVVWENFKQDENGIVR